ncbi:hypothetical protein NHQ30_002157 [Ciborinia camelliae]|nr:hypothetical protein NHQ30_002157 [Ciborinia camelliae]
MTSVNRKLTPKDRTLDKIIMLFDFAQEMDLLCGAFERLTIEDKFDRFTCFSKLPRELQLMIWKEAITEPVVHDLNGVFTHNQSVIPEMLSGINWLSLNEAKKVYKRLTYEGNCYPAFFNTQYDSVLFSDFTQLGIIAMHIRSQVVHSIQCSARICELRPPLVDIDSYLELQYGDYDFPYCRLKTFIVQDLQCSRKHRLQDVTERVLCKEALRRYFVNQHHKYNVMIPEIIIRVPPLGKKLCYECKKIDDWLAMPVSLRSRLKVSIIDRQAYTPRQSIGDGSGLPDHIPE